MATRTSGMVNSPRMRGRIAVSVKRYDSQRKAEAKYKKDKVKKVTLQFCPTEYDLYEHLNNQSPKATYIKDLIRADMNKQQ